MQLLEEWEELEDFDRECVHRVCNYCLGLVSFPNESYSHCVAFVKRGRCFDFSCCFRKALAFTQKRYPRLRLDQRIHEAASNHHKQCTAD
jgi:hypothetical protein